MGHAQSYELARIAERFDAELVQDTLAEVAPLEQAVRTGSGKVLSYDHLVLATGARATPAHPHAITFGEDRREEALHGLLRDAEEGYCERIAFVVPNESTWSLPLYELALMTARQALDDGRRPPRDRLRDPRGPAARDLRRTGERDRRRAARRRRHRVHGSAYTTVEHGHLIVDPGGRRIDVNRVVSLPRLEGMRIPGVPRDAEGSSRSTPRPRGRARRRLRRRRRDRVPDQAGRARHPAGRRRRRDDRRGRRRADRAAALPARPARDAAHGRRQPLHAQRGRGRQGRARGREPRAVVAAEQGRRAATSPRSCSTATSSTRSSGSAATTSRWRPTSAARAGGALS